MAFRRSYLDEDEIFWLLYDTDKNVELNDESNDRFDENDQMSSEDEKDAIEDDCEDDVDSIYSIDDMNKLDESNTTIQQPKKAQMKMQIVMKPKTLHGEKYRLE